MRRLLIASFLAAACLLAWVAHWWWMPAWSQATPLDIEITPGQSAGQVADTLAGAGASGPAWLWTAYFRLSGQSARMKAGVYEIAGGTTPAAVLDKFVRGDQALRSITFVEGWTFRMIRDSLSKAEHLRQDSRSLSAEKIMEVLGKAGIHPEGRFFPDTYSYGKSTSDLELLRRAAAAMEACYFSWRVTTVIAARPCVERARLRQVAAIPAASRPKSASNSPTATAA